MANAPGALLTPAALLLLDAAGEELVDVEVSFTPDTKVVPLREKGMFTSRPVLVSYGNGLV